MSMTLSPVHGRPTPARNPVRARTAVVLAAALAALSLSWAAAHPAHAAEGQAGLSAEGTAAPASETGFPGIADYGPDAPQPGADEAGRAPGSPDAPYARPASPDGPGGQPDQAEYNTAAQLTEDDILAMNGGLATLLHTDGYLTFLQGTFYEGRVDDFEDAVAALNGVASLIGIGKGSEFFAVYADRNSSGYTVYTFMQRYGDLTIENAVLKVVVDPDGRTAGLVSSFVPNIGIAPTDESSITAEEAEAVVAEMYEENGLAILSDYTRQTSVTIDDVAIHAWAVFSDYPDRRYASDGRAYLEHIVAYDGSYLLCTAVTSPEELVLGDDALSQVAASWFDGLEPDVFTGTVTLHDGSTRQVSVPVARDAQGTYYLADVSRHIALADFHSFVYDGFVIDPWTSADNTGWPDRYLITYDTYIRVYDLFAAYGHRSTDGFGSPILILTDLCDENHVPEDNAGYMGKMLGWALLAASDVNDYGECVDVCGHEFTHGVTWTSMAGEIYENETGAVNEALSDIMGNLCQSLLGDEGDGQWLIAERSGRTLRNMSFPWEHGQPVTVGGKYYQEPSDHPGIADDLGGIHTNSSLLGHIAWLLVDAGMTPEEAFGLWMDAISLLTPQSGHREVHAALLFAAEMRGMDITWFGIIDMLFEQAGY